MYLCRKYSYGQVNKNMICSPVCACVQLGKVYWVYMSIVGRSKEEKKLTLLTYMCMCVNICEGPKLCAFVFLSPHVRFLMIFGNDVSHSGSRLNKIACFFDLSDTDKDRLTALATINQVQWCQATVEKRKISYFVLARYLIQHWISPNQDDLSHSARTFISG